MSDTSQGPGWWLASDGKWYPPHAAAGATGTAATAGAGGGLEAAVTDVMKKLHPFGLIILAAWIAIMVLLLMVGIST